MAKTARRTEKTAPEKLDVATFDALAPWLETGIAKWLGHAGQVGDEPPLVALAGITTLVGAAIGNRRLETAGKRMLLAHVIAAAIKTFGKNNVDRSRPQKVLKGGGYRMEPGSSKNSDLRSFPSGHTAGSVAVARAFARDYPHLAVHAYAAAGAIGALQIARRAHFPTDILAGAAVGIVAEAIAARVMARS